MSFLLWKMQSKVSSAYSLVGISALMRKNCRWWSLLWVYEKMWESCRKAHLHPWDHTSSLPPPQGSFNVSFPSQSLICLWGWEQSSPVSTAYALLKVSSNSPVVHTPRWSTEQARTQAPPMYPARWPRDTPVRAALCSSGVVVLHSSLQLRISSDVLSLYRRVKARSRTG